MIKVFTKFADSFETNGEQILDDYIIDPEVSETLNGIFSLTFKYPIFKTKYLEEESIIVTNTPKGGDQPFRISKLVKEMGYYNVTAYHIFYDLSDNLIEDINIEKAGGTYAMQKISDGAQYNHPFKLFSDISSVNNCRIVRYNLVQAILDSSKDNTFVSRWGGEIERNNYNVTMHSKLGTDRGIQIRYRKNLSSYEADVDFTQVCTRIMPKGAEELLLPEKYVDSENIDYYPHPKIRVIEYNEIKAKKDDPDPDPDTINSDSDDDGGVPLDEAYQMLRDAAKKEFEENHIDTPKANYKVNFVELSGTEEYKDIQVLEKVYLGDTVRVIHEDENLDIEARVISYKYNPLNKTYNEIELGNFLSNFSDTVNKDFDKKLTEAEESFLDEAKQNATDLINNGFGGFVRIHPDKILIMDTDDEMTAMAVWQFNKNGLGFSSTGINGPYGLAMTSDGAIVADFITAGILNASLIRAGVLEGQNFELDLDAGTMVLGTEPGRQFIVKYDGSIITPEITADDIEAGAITTDILRPGANRRIVMEPGYGPGEVDCMSIDTNTSGIRLKRNSTNYINILTNAIDFYLNGCEYRLKAYDSSTLSFNGMELEDSNGIAIKSYSGYEDTYLRIYSSGGMSSYVNGSEYNHTRISDVNLKENVSYLSSKNLGLNNLINKNKEHFSNVDISADDLHDFVKKDLKLCQYNFNDEYYEGNIENVKNKLKFGFIAQDVMNTKVSKLIFNSGDCQYEESNYINIIAGALQKEIQKNEDREQRISDLESRILALERKEM